MSHICLADKKKLCGDCAVSHTNQGHKIESLSEIIKQAKSYKKEFDVLGQTLDSHLKKSKELLFKQMNTQINTIKTRFEKVKEYIEEAEADLCFETQCVFDHQLRRIEANLGPESTLAKEIHSQSLKMNNILKGEEVLVNMSDLKNVSKRICNFKEKVSSAENCQNVQDILDENIRNMKTFSLKLEEYSRSFESLLSTDSLNNTIQTFPQHDNNTVDQVIICQPEN